MNKKYLIALSYANSNEGLAGIVSEELDNTFDKAFFKDTLRREELSVADPFENTLGTIFQNSLFAVVLYSEEYKTGEYAPKELEEIINKAKKEKSNNFFIIKVDDSQVEIKELPNPYYITLNPCDCKTEEETRQKVSEIVQENIKTYLIKWSVLNKKEDGKYKLNIHTVLDNGNKAKWLECYDWNILAKKYVDMRDIKEPYTWNDLWDSIRTDFNIIKGDLEDEKNTLRVIRFNCHLSIAYKLGQIYGNLNQPTGNRNLQLLSSNGDTSFVFKERRKKRGVTDFCEECIKDGDEEETDIVCIISIKNRYLKDILEGVKGFLVHEEQKYKSIYMFQAERSIDSTEELESLADYIFNKMLSACTGNNCRFHLFLDTITPLAFVLGGRRPFPGEVQLYEYLENGATYKKSLTRGTD